MAKNPDETTIMQKIAELRQILRDTDPDDPSYETYNSDLEDAIRDLGMYDDMASGAKN
jgi:hypothetical protein